MKIVLLQINTVRADPKNNYEKVKNLLKKYSPKPKSLLVLPEMFSTGFLTGLENPAAGIPDNIYQMDISFLSGIAKKYKCYILGSSINRPPPCKKSGEIFKFKCPTGY